MPNVIQVNIPVELTFISRRNLNDPFNEVNLDVLIRDRNGQSWKLPAYWAGGNRFKARFAPPAAGRYTYQTECSTGAIPGLSDAEGSFTVRPYAGKNRLYRHGRLRVARSLRSFEHLDGTPFLWLGDTWWAGFTSRLAWPRGFKLLSADRVEKGFNVVQIVAGPLPDFDAQIDSWHPLQANENGLCWEKNWARINPAFYDIVDLKVKHMVESGLVPCLVGMWGYYLPYMGVERVKQHWRYLIARYGAYPVVWCAAGELALLNYAADQYVKNKLDLDRMFVQQISGWQEVIPYMRGLDPHHNLITAHPCKSSRVELRSSAELLDFEMLQTGHGGRNSYELTIAAMEEALARRPQMPVLLGEVCYEGIMGSSWQDVQRFMFWTSMTMGAAGYTYGAQGIWGMNCPEQPYVGWTGSWGDGYWKDAMHYPGSTHVGIGRRFFDSYPWWLFKPRPDFAHKLSLCPFSFATGIPRAIAVYYLPTCNSTPRFVGVQASGGRVFHVTVEKSAKYHAFFFNPRTAARIDLGLVKPDQQGRWELNFKQKTMEDWVLVLEDKKKLAQITRNRGK